MPSHIFHLAIPCRDLDEAEDFYATKLGCRPARRYSDRITLDFFDHQVVCHLAPDLVELRPTLYPRHFGITFRERKDFDAILDRSQKSGLEFFCEPFVRYADRPEEHSAFVLLDPSQNLIEFKYYSDPAMMF